MLAVLRAMAEYDCSTLLVVDDTGRLAGIITGDDVSPQVFSCSPDDAAQAAQEIPGRSPARRPHAS
ncbi:MAG TPA: CBS domain-containing protein [Vicinamibacterales bacterium]|nr:CBS domain-containing protein [Vicinamibacterales bacterium]